jgi:hypothetical protein
MFKILGEGEQATNADPHLPYRGRDHVGRLRGAALTKRGNSLEPLAKWRGDGISNVEGDEGKREAASDRGIFGEEDVSVVLPHQQVELHIRHLAERLEGGVRDVAGLKLQLDQASRDAAVAKTQIQYLTEAVQNLQYSSACADAARANEHRQVLALQQAVQVQHSTFMAEIASRDSRIQQLAQESHDAHVLNTNSLQNLSSNLNAKYRETEQVLSSKVG